MALQTSFYKSSATSGALENLGGAISASLATGSIFLATPGSGLGLTGERNYYRRPIYRCLYIKNVSSPAKLYYNVSVSIAQTSSAYYSMEIAPSAAGLNSSAESISSELDLPNITGLFSQSISLGDIPVGQHYAFWIRLVGKDAAAGGNGGWGLSVTGQYQ